MDKKKVLNHMFPFLKENRKILLIVTISKIKQESKRGVNVVVFHIDN